MNDAPARAAAPSTAFRIAAAAALALLLVHVWAYRFLTDDAYISFRYARNLADGYGLVFNPGFERVEGYTNFLWVVTLAAFDRVGVAPEKVANILSTLCGVAIVLALSRYLARLRGRPVWIAVLPLFLLAGSRSFAVWCTSGLETKLFEMLVVLGVLQAIAEIDAARAGGRESWARSSLLLALACLTRPDGALVAGCVLGARALVERRRGGAPLGAIARGAGILAAIVGAHLAFRLAYYGDWVPNTYHAKVGGQTWFSMGASYALTFAIEYGVVFWAPLLIASLAALRREGRAHHGLLFAAATLPHAASVIAIGGDHFEYRPLDLIFPFAFVLVADGAAALVARGRAGTRLAAALLALLFATMLTIPLLTHLGFARDYRAGFPGTSSRADGTRDLVSGARFPLLFRIPVVAQVLEFYNAQIEETTRHAVGIRQEEHALFLPTVASEGKLLAELVADGTLPPDTHIAIGSVGAIPYYSNLRTLDRQGLTDRIVAKGEGRPDARRLMAHNKLASFEDAAARGADLWSPDGTHLLFGADPKRLQGFIETSIARGSALVAARAGREHILLAEVPGGAERAAARLPRTEPATQFFLREAQHPSAPAWILAFLGDLLDARGNRESAVSAFKRAVELDPEMAIAWNHLGMLVLRSGDPASAAALLERALEIDPRTPKYRSDVMRAYAQRGDFAGTIRVLREGLTLAPHDMELQTMLARFLATCPDPRLRDPAEAVRIAERLRRSPRGRSASLLDTLAGAYAAAGRFADARAAALEAADAALAVGDSAGATEIRMRADAYANGHLPWALAPDAARPGASPPDASAPGAQAPGAPN
ncbi:MAG: tetratricopeptide repeat protein [bacterium]